MRAVEEPTLQQSDYPAVVKNYTDIYPAGFSVGLIGAA